MSFTLCIVNFQGNANREEFMSECDSPNNTRINFAAPFYILTPN
jgi:hypothetical protein